MEKDKVQELVQQLDEYDTYDKENILIDIFVAVLEEKCNLDDIFFTFIELSILRDRTLSNGSDSYFETFNKDEYKLRIFPILDDEIRDVFRMGEDEKYEEIDQWMIDNEWKYNDYLSRIIKSKYDIELNMQKPKSDC